MDAVFSAQICLKIAQNYLNCGHCFFNTTFYYTACIVYSKHKFIFQDNIPHIATATRCFPELDTPAR